MLQRWLILSTTLLISGVLHAAPTTIQSWAAGLTNPNVYKYTDVLPTPSGWNAPATGQTQPSPPGMITQSADQTYWDASVTNGAYYSSLSAICAAATSEHFGSVGMGCGANSYWNPTPVAGQGGYCAIANTDYRLCNPAAAFTPNWSPCPVGYTASTTVSGQCNLTTPTLVKKPGDSICTLIIKADGTCSIDDGGTLNGGDPDCIGAWTDSAGVCSDKPNCCEVISPVPAVGNDQ